MNRLAWLIATACGIGRAPIASGTVASAVAAGLWVILHPGLGAEWAVCGAMIVAGVWAADRVAKRLGDDDPSVVVIDEFAGMWLALLGLPMTLPVVCAAFLLFRFFDIGKFPPMKQLERLPGGWGIMADDAGAGCLTRLLLSLWI
jgi:phosphatidylglycerophosphatase A